MGAHAYVFKLVSFALGKKKNRTLSLSHSSSGATDETRFDTKKPARPRLRLRLAPEPLNSPPPPSCFPQTQTQLTSFKSFSVALFFFSPPSASQSSPLPPGRREGGRGGKEFERLSVPPGGPPHLITPPLLAPHGNMSGVIGEVRQRYSN